MATTTTSDATGVAGTITAAATTADQFLTRGKVIRVKDGGVVFTPAGTNYELKLLVAGGRYDGPVGAPVDALLRVQARKVYSVPSGGNWVAPIFGPPRIVQGRVRHIEDGRLVVHAAASFVVELPPSDDAIDLNDGAIAVGRMVNVTTLPGATFELTVAGSPAGR